MKRFVTYLYECERGNKTKNTGFIRVNVRGSKAELEVYIRNVSRVGDVGKIFALVYNEGLIGIELNEIEIKNGQSDSRIVIETEDIKNSSFSLHDVEGIGIRWDSGLYIASCWKDIYAREIAGGEFRDTEELKQALILEPMACPNTEQMPVTDDRIPLLTEELFTTYEKIDLSQIRDLPSPNWHLATNSFLVHGFWNYGYLVLKKNVEEGQKMLSLGEEELGKRIFSCGLYRSKAKHLIETCRALIETYGGQVPATLEQLKPFPA